MTAFRRGVALQMQQIHFGLSWLVVLWDPGLN